MTNNITNTLNLNGFFKGKLSHMLIISVLASTNILCLITLMLRIICIAQRPNLMLIIRFLRHKHLFQLQVKAFNTTSQSRGESVQGNQGHRLRKNKSNTANLKAFLCLIVHVQ